MKVTETKLPCVIVIEPVVFGDTRGWLLETYSQKRYEQAGITDFFVQDNVSLSGKGVLRGLHYQYPHSQGKLVQVLAGEVFDVVVDVRPGSPTFSQWVSQVLSESNHRQMYVPAGFAHGFCVLSDIVIFSYKCTDYYSPSTEGGIIWNDPVLGIDWPVSDPILSGKDAEYPMLGDIPKDKLPKYEETV